MRRVPSYVFDQFESFHNPKRSGWIRIAVTTSVIAHVAAAAALIINAAWKLNKLQIQDPELAIAAFGLPSAAPPALAAEKREQVKKPIKTKTDELAQKTDEPDVQEVTSATGVGTADGDPNGEGDSKGNTPGGPIGSLCPNGLCLTDITPPETKKPEPTRTKTVSEGMVSGLFKKGERQIRPSSTVKTTIARSSKKKVHGIIHTCIGTTGRVVSAKVLKSTGYPSYDAKLLGGVRRWQYDPYKFEGRPIKVCTAINFIYKLERY